MNPEKDLILIQDKRTKFIMLTFAKLEMLNPEVGGMMTVLGGLGMERSNLEKASLMRNSVPGENAEKLDPDTTRAALILAREQVVEIVSQAQRLISLYKHYEIPLTKNKGKATLPEIVRNGVTNEMSLMFTQPDVEVKDISTFT